MRYGLTQDDLVGLYGTSARPIGSIDGLETHEHFTDCLGLTAAVRPLQTNAPKPNH